MNKQKILPIILCGGSGSRLWPLSRANFPKQFLSLLEKSKNTLLQDTILRISEFENIDSPIFLCNEIHRFLVAEQMRRIDINPNSIILEPSSRNTCAAISLAAIKAVEEENDPILVVLSSDHIIKNNKLFLRSVFEAIKIAANGNIVTFGIVPSSPEVGYGYIKSGDTYLNESIKSFKIDKFIEKPNYELAEKLIAEKNYTWNSGMFVFKASTVINELQKYEPEILNDCRKALKNGFKDLDFQRLDKKIFNNCKNISFDISIMEKTDLGIVIPIDVGWSDVGNWTSIWDNEDKDKDNNVLSGNVLAYDVKNSYIRSENKLLVCNGLHNIVAVETNDAILISNKEKSQDVKNIVEDIISKGYAEAKETRINYRPWGNYISIADDSRWQVKKIEVKPGARLSLQMHYHRSEHWIVVKGIAKVNIDSKESLLKENQSVFIPLGSKHRLTNTGEVPLILIEVQSGTYLGEDDIVRFQDDYGRK